MTDYPLLQIFWTMVVFFGWTIWIWMLFSVFSDVIRRTDISGWAKAGWMTFTILLPFLGVLLYIGFEGKGWSQRSASAQMAREAQSGEYVREVPGQVGATSEIARAHQLLAAGALTQAEFDSIKARALA